jgi:hypothetical protein
MANANAILASDRNDDDICGNRTKSVASGEVKIRRQKQNKAYCLLRCFERKEAS